MTNALEEPTPQRPRRSQAIEALIADSSRRSHEPQVPGGPGSLSAFEVLGQVDHSLLHSIVNFDAETDLIATASSLRRRHFLAGRSCAHAALSALGVHHEGIGRHDSRAPLWPSGVIGAITHTEGYVAAAIAHDPAAEFGIGIDAEQVGRVDEGVARRVMNEAERDAVAGQADEDVAATALFCAKESFYKAQWPHTKAWVGFEDVTVSFEGDGTITTTSAGPAGTLVLRPATERPALNDFVWPIVANYFVAGQVTVAGLVASHRR